MCNTLGLDCMQGPGSSICNLHQLRLQLPGMQCMAALTNPFDKLLQISVSLAKCTCIQSIKETHWTSGNNSMIDVSTSGLVMSAQSTSMQGSILHYYYFIILYFAVASGHCRDFYMRKGFCVSVNHLTMHASSHAALLPL